MNCMNITYTLRRVSNGWIVGHAHESQKLAEQEAQELAAVNCEVVAVIENLVWDGGDSVGTTSIVGSTGVVYRAA